MNSAIDFYRNYEVGVADWLSEEARMVVYKISGQFESGADQGLRKRRPYLKTTVHQGFVEVDDHAFLVHVLVPDAGQQKLSLRLRNRKMASLTGKGRGDRINRLYLRGVVTPLRLRMYGSIGLCSRAKTTQQRVEQSSSRFLQALGVRDWNKNTIGLLCKVHNTAMPRISILLGHSHFGLRH